ncbi:MAG: hypothetical protein QM638_22405 [Nocardioides sp.]|uniref:hypothetical protein n=1 Tax=Nocardioides sp. TaxID=35761 RepID=UPI0039E5E6E6
MATAETAALAYGRSLRDLYVIRFGFAIIWVGIMVATVADATEPTALLTVVLIVYPAFDAGAVLWQLRVDPDHQRSKVAEWTNVVVSLAVVIALGVSSSITIHGALAVWGGWAIVSGIPQLIAAIHHRRSGGQVAQMFSGGISVFAGAGLLAQGLRGNGTMTGAAGYAALGAIFFLVSAVRLSVRLRRSRT